MAPNDCSTAIGDKKNPCRANSIMFDVCDTERLGYLWLDGGLCVELMVGHRAAGALRVSLGALRCSS